MRTNYIKALLEEGYNDALEKFEIACERSSEEKAESPEDYLPDGRPTPKYLGNWMNAEFWESGSEYLEEKYPHIFDNHSFDWVGEHFFEGFFKFVKEKYAAEEAVGYI